MRKSCRLLTLSLYLISTLAYGDFAFRDGDTVAFLGDSITAARGYTKIVEHYTLMRFPERKVLFVNAGQGGDTASGSLKRLESDVFSTGATVVTVTFGINDIGWGTKANEESKQRYLDGIRQIIEQCRKRGIRPIICSPAITAEAPDKAETGFLQRMADEGLALAQSLGADTVDIQRGMREAQRRIVAANEKEPDQKKHTRLHVNDGVHLSDLGQLSMAYAMLKGLGAPEDVSSVELDANAGTLLNAKGYAVSKTQKQEDGITFVRMDKGLPITLGGFSGFDFRWVPIPDGLNRYMLTVRNFPPGDYEITAGGRSLGKTTAERLARGLNISTMTAVPLEPGGPWDAQSLIVKELVDARDKWEAGERIRKKHQKIREDFDTLASNAAEQIIAYQRAVARPVPYHFTIKKISEVIQTSSVGPK